MKSDYLEIYGNNIPGSLTDYFIDITRLQSAYCASLNLCNADSEMESVKRLAIKITQNEISNQAIELIIEDSYIVNVEDAIDCLIVIFPKMFGILPINRDLEREVDECSSLFDILYQGDGEVRLNKELEHVLPKIIALTNSLDDVSMTYEICDEGEGYDFEEDEHEKELMFDSTLSVNNKANLQNSGVDVSVSSTRSNSEHDKDDLESNKNPLSLLGVVILCGVGYLILLMYWHYIY